MSREDFLEAGGLLSDAVGDDRDLREKALLKVLDLAVEVSDTKRNLGLRQLLEPNIAGDVIGVILDFLITFRHRALDIYVYLHGDYSQRKTYIQLLEQETELRESEKRKILALGNGDIIIGTKNTLVYQEHGVIYFETLKEEMPVWILEELLNSERELHFYSRLGYNFRIPREHGYFELFRSLISSEPEGDMIFYSYFDSFSIVSGPNGVCGPGTSTQMISWYCPEGKSQEHKVLPADHMFTWFLVDPYKWQREIVVREIFVPPKEKEKDYWTLQSEKKSFWNTLGEEDQRDQQDRQTKAEEKDEDNEKRNNMFLLFSFMPEEERLPGQAKSTQRTTWRPIWAHEDQYSYCVDKIKGRGYS